MRAYWLILLALVLAACRAGASQAVPTPTSSTLNPNLEALGTTIASPTSMPATQTPGQTVPPTIVEDTPTQNAVAPLSRASQLPDSKLYRWELVASGLARPVGLGNAGDGSKRVFILEQEGVVRVWREGELYSQPFLDIRDRVGANSSEQGLLGLAFHPRYPENGYFYVNYTDQNGDTHISRFSVSTDNPDIADPASEQALIFVAQPYRNHNGGSVVFGPDGYLYLGLGDGGAGGDPEGNAQSTQTMLGKILRIDVDSANPYQIPPDNPFSAGGGVPEIWASGLRNPWRFSFDSLTGDAYIADVGQNEWEEINFLPAGSQPGANFGWDFREGNHRYEGINLGNGLIDPVTEYSHSLGCSVTGGYVYRGVNLPAWQGVYVYGDYCSGNVWGLLQNSDGTWQNSLLFQTETRISSFGLDEAGEVYLVNYLGDVYLLTQ